MLSNENLPPGEHWLPYGRYRGQSPRDVPTSYLVWMLKTCKLSSGLHDAIRAEVSARPDCPSDLPPGPPPKAPPTSCWRCGAKDIRVSWHEQAGGRSAIRADCGMCGRFISSLPLSPENVTRANACRSPTGLLDVLMRANDEGVELVRFGHEVRPSPFMKASDTLLSLCRQHQHALLRHLVRQGK
jgi:hypothetical protein